MDRVLRGHQMPCVLQSKDDWRTTGLHRGVGLQLSDVSFDAGSSSYGPSGSTFQDDTVISWSFLDADDDNLRGGGSALSHDDVELEMAFEDQRGRSRENHSIGKEQRQHTPPVEIPGRIRSRRSPQFSPQAILKTAMWRGKERRLMPRRRRSFNVKERQTRTLDFEEEDSDGLFKMEF